MLLRARDNNIQSLADTWLNKGNQNEFLKHPKIKWEDGGPLKYSRIRLHYRNVKLQRKNYFTRDCLQLRFLHYFFLNVRTILNN